MLVIALTFTNPLAFLEHSISSRNMFGDIKQLKFMDPGISHISYPATTAKQNSGANLWPFLTSTLPVFGFQCK